MSTSSKNINIWPQHAAKFSGGWKCITFEILSSTSSDSSNSTTEEKIIRKPHGDTPLGYAVLTRNGYLSAQMSVPALIDAFKATGSQWRESADADIAKVARGLAMYCGYLELYEGGEAEGLWWATRCDVSVDPNRIGRLEKRKAKYFQEGGKEYMILQPFGDELTPNADHVRAVLKWEKFESSG